MIATQLQKKTLSLGFLGLGWIGRNRMQVLHKNEKTRVLAITEPLEENAQEALKIATEAELKDSFAEMLKDGRLDGIVIATPSALHARQCIKALKAEKHVFCQKPLGRTAAEVKEVLDTSKEVDKLLAVDLSYRYTKAFRAIYNLLKKGEIGEIYAVDLVFHNAYGPDKEWFYDYQKSGGGCVMDLGVHLIDLTLWCLGFPEIKDVDSHLFNKGKKLEPEQEQVEDFARVSMISEKDTHINLECSWHVSAGRDAVIEANFYGTKGGAAFKNINGSFYDFTAEKYEGTQTETLVSPPDDWSGRAGIVWSERLIIGHGYDKKTAKELLQTAVLIDRIYKRGSV